MASTFPGPLRWIAADGPTSLKSVRWAFQAGKTSLTSPADLVAYVPEETLDKGVYPSKATAFNKMCDMIDFWVSEAEVDQWNTLVLDSATEINDWSMNLGLNLNVQLPKPDKPLSTSHKVNEQAKVRLITGQQDYKSAMALFEGFIADVRSQCAKANKNLVILCHEWTEESEKDDGSTIVRKYRPLLMGQLRTKIAKSFDDVWYMTVYNGKDFKVMVHPDPKHEVKTRWGQIVDREEPADFRELIKKVRAYHGL
jgi:hypothetical protein